METVRDQRKELFIVFKGWIEYNLQKKLFTPLEVHYIFDYLIARLGGAVPSLKALLEELCRVDPYQGFVPVTTTVQDEEETKEP